MSINPIETHYRGHRFRSRMEARWAVFMDAVGVQWLYELDGFKLASGVCYLPDFFLPEMNAWLEVKNPSADDMRAEESKVEGLVSLTGKDAYLFKFPPAPPRFDKWQETTGTYCFGGNEPHWDEGYLWCECPMCGRVGIQYNGWADRIQCGCSHEGRVANYDSEKIQEAYWRAAACRFTQSDT